MLESFSVSNFLSIKEKLTITMISESISELPKNLYKTPYQKFELLKGLGLFGLNSSGKSNILKAIQFCKSFILGNTGGISSDNIEGTEPFRLDDDTLKLPSEFEFIFWVHENRYRYGFKCTKKSITEEWLLVVENKKEKVVYERQIDSYYFGREYKKLMERYSAKVRYNELFITFCTRISAEFGEDVTSWFKNLDIFIDYNPKDMAVETMKMLKEPKYQLQLETIMKHSDFGIETIKLISLGNNIVLETGHKVKSNKPETDIVWFNLLENESVGTIKYFGLLGPILKTLQNGGLLIIDEIDSGFHAELGIHLIGLFYSTFNDKRKPQLIFSSHNNQIWDRKTLRRDQQIHVEKDQYGASSVKRTYDYKVRKSKSIKRSYDSGELSQVPTFRQLDLFDDLS